MDRHIWVRFKLVKMQLLLETQILLAYLKRSSISNALIFLLQLLSSSSHEEAVISILQLLDSFEILNLLSQSNGLKTIYISLVANESIVPYNMITSW